MLCSQRAEPGRYLHALEALRDSPFLARCKRTTRLRLQMELHSLTQARALAGRVAARTGLCCASHTFYARHPGPLFPQESQDTL